MSVTPNSGPVEPRIPVPEAVLDELGHQVTFPSVSVRRIVLDALLAAARREHVHLAEIASLKHAHRDTDSQAHKLDGWVSMSQAEWTRVNQLRLVAKAIASTHHVNERTAVAVMIPRDLIDELRSVLAGQSEPRVPDVSQAGSVDRPWQTGQNGRVVARGVHAQRDVGYIVVEMDAVREEALPTAHVVVSW